MKKITVIGSESFLARNYLKYLGTNRSDYTVYGYDVADNSRLGNYTQINFADKNSISNINFDVDFVFIFIGKTGTVNGFKEYELFIKVNEIYLLNILSSYIEKKSKAIIIYPSTRLLFQESKMPINELSTHRLKSIYAITKEAAENYLELYYRTYGIKYVILRICTPYGSLIDSKGNYGTFEIFYNQAKTEGKIVIFGDGEQKKTYTQMRDICEAFCRLMEASCLAYRDYNLGGQALSINSIAQIIANEFGAQIEHIEWPEIYKMVDGGSVIFDSSRFDKEFGMRYHMVIEDI